jgi:hypothetical protein
MYVYLHTCSPKTPNNKEKPENGVKKPTYHHSTVLGTFNWKMPFFFLLETGQWCTRTRNPKEGKENKRTKESRRAREESKQDRQTRAQHGACHCCLHTGFFSENASRNR